MDDRRFDIARYLSLLPLFTDLRADELQRIAAGSAVRRYARGDMVCRLGEPCEGFHVVVTGQVKLSVLSPLGQEKVIELAGPGHTFGEALMFSGRPYVVSVQALADSTLLAVSKATVFAEIERDPRFAMRMLAGMSRRLHGLIHDVQAYTLHSGMQRIIGYLLRDGSDGSDGGNGARDPGPAGSAPGHDGAEGGTADPPATPLVVSLPASKATIASRLSITPEYFSRVLHELESAGLIEVDKRELRIRDPARLSRYPMR
jgi:CRP-like cAMP-binding protein